MLLPHGQPAKELAIDDSIDEPYLYHDVTSPGFTCLFVPGAPERQRSFKLEALPERLKYARGLQLDAYVAQNVFWRPNRQVRYLWRLKSLYIDLDTYKIPELKGMSAEGLSAELLAECRERGIPEPTVIVYSGRGLQAKWVLTSPLPKSALPRWKAVQEELCRRLASLGSDRKALDASRVLRVVGTVNTKTGEMVRVVHLARVPAMGASRLENGAVGYDFEVLAETLLPLTRDEVRFEPKPKPRVKESARIQSVGKAVLGPTGARMNGPLRSTQQLAWDRLRDLERLLELRGWEEGAPEGNRNACVFLAACFLAHAVPADELRGEVLAFAGRYAPSWSEGDALSCASSVIARAEGRPSLALRSGTEIGEKEVRYRLTNRFILEMLAITPPEQECMRTLIGKEEKQRRDKLRKQSIRRSRGVVPREAYEARSADLADQARALQRTGMSFARIAKSLGVSKASAFRYCQASAST